MILPSNKKDLIKKIVEVKEICRVSVGQRAALARTQSLWLQTGRATGARAVDVSSGVETSPGIKDAAKIAAFLAAARDIA